MGAKASRPARGQPAPIHGGRFTVGTAWWAGRAADGRMTGRSETAAAVALPLLERTLETSVQAGITGSEEDIKARVAQFGENVLPGPGDRAPAPGPAAAATPTSRVLRDGKEVAIPTSAVVVGDVLLLRAGEAVAADGVVAESDGLAVYEAELTGEPEPVPKAGGGADTVFGHTVVRAGTGTVVVTAVGPNSLLGTVYVATR